MKAWEKSTTWTGSNIPHLKIAKQCNWDKNINKLEYYWLINLNFNQNNLIKKFVEKQR